MSVLSVFHAAKESPRAPAVVTRDGALSFAQAAERAARVASWLEQRRGGPETNVAVVAALRIETVIALYALFELGIPALLVHPRLTAGERAALLAPYDVAVVIDETWSDADLPPSSFSGTEVVHDPERPLAILFTSGTSGRAKGVALSRRAFVASAEASAANLGWETAERWILSMPLAHVGGLSVVVRSLVARKTVVLSPWTGDVGAMLDEVARARVTLVSVVPAMLRVILDEREAPFPSHVRAVLLGGDAAPASLLDECARRAIPALTTYGMTEACSQVATQAFGEAPSIAAGVGRPLPGVDVRIAEGGEIQVRGRVMMSGYVPADLFPSPLLEGGWFPTGDLGALDEEGRLHVLGRSSDRIITGGENVDPIEVERALVAIPGVAAACVFGVADERWGQTVAAAVVIAGDAPDLAAAIEVSLAKWKRPRAIAIVDALPVTASGKLDRRGAGARLREKLVPLRPR